MAEKERTELKELLSPRRESGSVPQLPSTPLDGAEKELSGAFDLPWVAHRTARGVVFSSTARGSAFIASFLGGILLARRLTPIDFGIYALVSFVVIKLGSLAQLGLNTTIIHDHNDPSDRNLRSVFTLLSLNTATMFVAIFASSAFIVRAFRFSADVKGFVHLVAAMLLFQPFWSIPSALLARRLAYDRLALADVVSAIVYQGTAVGLAYAGFSYWSFGWAALCSSLCKTLVLSSSSPWRIGFAWDATFLKHCIRFGGAFQLSGMTSLARDNISLLLGGPLFGPAAVGLLTWALRLNEVCSQEFVAIVSYVSFPSLSRVRSDLRLFSALLNRMLRYVNFATFFSLSVVSALLPEIVAIVYGNKWSPAIPLFYCFAIRMVSGNFVTLLDSAVKAHGRPERSLLIASCWTVWEWGLALLGARFFGFHGIAGAYAIGGWPAMVWLLYETKRFARIHLWRACGAAALAGTVTFLTLFLAKGNLIHSLLRLALAGVAGSAVYLIVMLALEGGVLFREIKQVAAYVLPLPTQR